MPKRTKSILLVSVMAALQGGAGGTCPRTPRCAEPCGRLVELWDAEATEQLSRHPSVRKVVALGKSPPPSLPPRSTPDTARIRPILALPEFGERRTA
jgi:hypothetical protein